MPDNSKAFSRINRSMLSMIHGTWRTQQITFVSGNNLTKVGSFEHQARLVSKTTRSGWIA
jgi:hypothetical protein